ncbi:MULTISPECIES: hypothetical protein [unclassified Streptomyces]|uniref:hypothetical protein n=1 Tax=unclassified Streptomyces TaxID=2593676 RepID=UPI003D910295
MLNEEKLTAAVATSVCANPLVTAESGRADVPPRRTEESGRSRRCDNRRHTTYWIRRWPQPGGSGTSLHQLVALLTAVPASAATFSLTLGRGKRQEVSLVGPLRVTGRSDDELVAARRSLEHAVRRAGAGSAGSTASSCPTCSPGTTVSSPAWTVRASPPCRPQPAHPSVRSHRSSCDRHGSSASSGFPRTRRK